MKTIRLLLVTLTMVMTQMVWAQSSPIPMLQTTANQILAALEQNKATLRKNPQVIYQAVERYLLPKVDVAGMSRSVLGRQAWMKASASERKQFSQAFTSLVIRTYATPLAEYTNETIKFLPIRGSLNNRFLRVNSVIVRPNGKNIPLSYSLVSKNGQWKIYDLSVEGVSLLQSFRSQFAQALQNSNMQELIRQMQQRAQKAA
ncbi:MlaC/ttg2D family ABC transporter substrate-binding protein [Legionella spiritensis]|uniref:Toluene tolerance protein Ttg2D n=1 Tax=Legionella spiritensis TaxID=452 RepID=A0A0W0ZAM7_LEGSP|nr:ABC transporter substrate-binding protein [Legionella spiritensis]KTD66188.1 toluene tolerance protein Ttg2D [Legionella spiritensis]SNV35135.1 signal peptide protein, toluene tolerance protein Ttg2D [Legionella spiritensis]